MENKLYEEIDRLRSENAAMRSNIAAKEIIWDSLIRDNMELGQAIQDIVNAYYVVPPASGKVERGLDVELERALDRALTLSKGGN